MTLSRTEATKIASRYAAAIFALTEHAENSEAVATELSALATAVTENKELASFLGNPLVAREAKALALNEIAKKGDPLTQQSLGTLAEQGRAELLPYVAEAFAGLVAESKGELTAKVTSARPLATAMEKQIIDALKKATGKTITLELAIDPAVLGGVRIELGSQLLDATLAGALSAMKTKLLQAS